MTLHVVAHFHARPDSGAALRLLLEPLVAVTRTEDGCLAYRLFQDEADPAHFVFVEEWRDAASLEVHLALPHLAAMVADAQPLLARPIEVTRLQEC
ncbi:putative quinol monooxygenase [Nocardioides aquiterrae]|uniref:Quinol monooxygenase n=1 Tax=Nocardioides aquiterrae TaxID=203799 RepID=A0ABP4EVE4_9ACTN